VKSLCIDLSIDRDFGKLVLLISVITFSLMTNPTYPLAPAKIVNASGLLIETFGVTALSLKEYRIITQVQEFPRVPS
jgi:hypothetical protein